MRHRGSVSAVVSDPLAWGTGTDIRKLFSAAAWPALLIGVAALLLWSGLTNGHDWGDDFAAYIMQARSIVEGRPFEFVEENRFTIEQSSFLIGPVAYPWGFLVLLAPLYALFGLDMMALKSAGAVCFLLFLLLLWSGFRRYHPDFWRIVLVCLFALNPTMLRFADQILSDIPFLLFSTLGVLLIGRLVIERSRLISPVWDPLLLGVAIAAAFFVRTNGILLLGTLAVTQLIALIQGVYGRSAPQDPGSAGLVRLFPTNLAAARHFGLHLLPYVSFASLVLVWRALLPEERVARRLVESEVSAEVIKHNVQYYIRLPAAFFDGVPFHDLVYGATIPLALAGAMARSRSGHHMIVYAALTFLLYVLWSPLEGLRFLFPVLPFYLSFVLSGLEKSTSGIAGPERVLRKGICILPIVLVLLAFGKQSASDALGNLARDRASLSGPFAATSKRMFSYIESHTEAESTIAFLKPRAMRMMTGRRSLLANKVGELSRVDYLCLYRGGKAYRYQNQISPGEVRCLNEGGMLRSVYENRDFVIYRIPETPSGMEGPGSCDRQRRS
jgi:hypothetical protein